MPEQVTFTVIGGFLGAGKTSLLNNVLAQAKDTRFAVLVNDFGALNIDRSLIEAPTPGSCSFRTAVSAALSPEGWSTRWSH